MMYWVRFAGAGEYALHEEAGCLQGEVWRTHEVTVILIGGATRFEALMELLLGRSLHV